MILNELMPPITKKLVKKLMGANQVFRNFEEANAALKMFNGYDDNELIKCIFTKTCKFLDSLKNPSALVLDAHHLFLLTTIALINKNDKIKVLDFGGAFGTHYYIAKAFFKHIQFEWTVVELPEVIKLGKTLQNDELAFLDIQGDFNQILGAFDLVLTSATLQHMTNYAQTLAFLTKQDAPFLALLRLGMTSAKEDLWTIHNAHFRDCGPGEPMSTCPNKIGSFTFCMLAEQNLEKALSDYQLMVSNHDLSGTVYVPDKKVIGYNRLYQRKS